MKLHNQRDKKTIEKYMDRINNETINCQESIIASKFKGHANQMMRDAYQLDAIIRENKSTQAYRTMERLKDYIKELQHPIILTNGDISNETYHEVTYILYCLGNLSDELKL